MNVIENYKLPEGRSLGMVVHEDGRPESLHAPEDFRWKLGGWTEALNWNPSRYCGGELYVWAWGQGDLDFSEIWTYATGVVWLAVEYDTASEVLLRQCVKVPIYKTIATSPHREDILSFIQKYVTTERQDPLFEVKRVENGTVTVGYGGVAITGDGGRATAGSGGKAVAGDGGTAQAGRGGTAIVGDGGYASVHDATEMWSDGYAIAGEGGYAVAGVGGTAMTGDRGTASVGSKGRAKAGEGGTLSLDGRKFLVGDGGLKPNTFYALDDLGNLVEAGE